MSDEILTGIFDPFIQTAGAAAMGATVACVGINKLRQTVYGKPPTETAIDSILPQAFARAMLAMQDGQQAIQEELKAAAQIDTLKEQLKTAKSREEKVRLWTEVTVQTYSISLVAPHIFSTLMISLALRSAVGVLAHLQQSAGLQLDQEGAMSTGASDKPSFISRLTSSLNAGATTAITSAVMNHLTNLLGTNAFAIDEADDINARSSGNIRSPDSFVNSDIIELLCEKVPILMQKARLCVMEQLGMVVADALSSIHQVTKGNASSRESTFSAERKQFGGSLIDVTQSAPLKFVEDAIWAAHQDFFDYVLEWQGDVFGGSSILFPELASRGPSASDRSDSPTLEDETPEQISGAGAFSFQSASDPVASSNYRRMTRRYMQDLLTSPDIDTLLRSYGEDNFNYWWKVLFFQLEISPSASDDTKADRAKRVCKSYDTESTNVLLLQYSLYADKARQELLLRPLFASGNGQLSIPTPIREFCEELIRSSGPK